MKKAKIITYYKSKNYGAFLQAFALQTFLESRGIDSYILEYTSRTEFLGKVVSIIKSRGKSLRKQQHLPCSEDYQCRMAAKVIEEQKKLKKTNELTLPVDVTILGSDEIWNTKNLGAAHDAFLFCPDKHARKTISYAACSGNAQAKHLSIFPYAKKGIRSLDAVSVRDDSTFELIKTIRKGEIDRVLDPTFLIDFTPFIPEKQHNKPYLFVYTYGLSESEIKEIQDLAQEKELDIIATGTNCEWADYNPVPSVFEWVSYIKNAEFVVTSTFHGTVLSIQQGTNFAVYNVKSPKIYSVLKEINLLDRAVDKQHTLSMIFENQINYTKINELLTHLRMHSQNYLLKYFDEQIVSNKKQTNPIPNKECYAFRHCDKSVRWASRSGGAFTAVSDIILNQKGVIYGAVCDNPYNIQHIRAETYQDRDRMRGSKYVQSILHTCLKQIVSDLKSGRTVLFTGTSCQTDAVRKLCSVKKCDKNLITMDFVCHGVPSPLIWRDYLSLYNEVVDVDFRNKKVFGWEDHKETIITKKRVYHTNIYTQLYYQDLITRPSCHKCPYAQYQRYSDITIGDCWGARKSVPGFNSDDSGVSMIIPNTDKGRKIVDFALQGMEYKKLSLSDLDQPVLRAGGHGTCSPSPRREQFWRDYKDRGIYWITQNYSTNNFIDQLKLHIRLPHKIKFAIKKIIKKI